MTAVQHRVIIFVESNTTGTGRVMLNTARVQGYECVLLAADAARYPFANQDGVAVVTSDTTRAQAVIDQCRRTWEPNCIAGVVSTSEYFVSVAAEVASALNLPGPAPEAILAARNKWRQMQRLSAAAVPVPATAIVRRADETETVAERFEFPIVAKPTTGSGSVGARLCSSPAELKWHVIELLTPRMNERALPVPSEVLVQEYIDGPQYSVETLGHHVVGITANHIGPAPHFVELGHEYPASLPQAIEWELRAVAIQALQALGLAWGPGHTEVRVTSAGPRVIEVNARLAGGWIPELVRLGSGVDMIAAVLNMSTGRPVMLTPGKPRVACIRFLAITCDGIVASLDGADEARALDHVADVQVYKQPGDVVRHHGDYRDRLGHVISVADTPLLAIAAAERGLACLDLRLTAVTGGMS